MVALTSTSPTTRPVASSTGRSYLAPDLIIRGQISCEGVVEIDAAMQGEIQANGLVIGPKGRVRAAIKADQAVIAGTVEGVLKAHSVTFANGCEFDGDVQYEAIGVEPNASVQGGMFPVLNASPRPQQQPLILTPSAGVGIGTEALSSPASPLKTDSVPLSSSRAVLWVVTLLGVLIGAGLAATISAPPPLRQWWAAYQHAKSEGATPTNAPASLPSAAPKAQPPALPQDTEAALPKAEPSTPASVEATRPVTTAPPIQAQTSSPPAADSEAIKQAAQDAATAKRQEITKATAEKVAAAKALAEKTAAARAEKAAAAAQSHSSAPQEQTAVPSQNQGQNQGQSQTEPVEKESPSPTETTTTAAKKTPPRKSATGSAAAAGEGSCSWVMRCDGPDNSGCVSTRQCD